MKVHRIIAIVLSIVLLFSSTARISFAVEEEPRVKLIQTVGDGLRYYIVYEINGHEFRSDRTGQRVNQMAFSLFNDEDKRAITRNYAYSPSSRVDQFGEIGSKTITEFGNEVTGWTEAAEIWQGKLETKYFEDLKYFYSQDSSQLKVGDNYLGESIIMYSSSVENNPDYKRYIELVGKIKTDFDVGKSFYERLVKIKVDQVGNAVKAGSEGIINIIIDNFMVPNITPKSTMKFSDSIVNAINLALESLGKLKEYASLPDPSIGDILAQMDIFINVLEKASRDLKIGIEKDLLELKSVIDRLNNAQEEVIQTYQANYEANKEKISNKADEAFKWSETIIEYEIIAETDEIKRLRIEEEARKIQREYTDYIATVNKRMEEIEKINISKTIDTNLTVIIEGAMSYYDIAEISEILPMKLYTSGGSYLEIESKIISKYEEKIAETDNILAKLYLYGTQYEELILNAGNDLNTVEEKINGLSEQYLKYVGKNLSDYVFLYKKPVEIKQTLEEKIVYQGSTIYEIIDTIEDKKILLQNNFDEFKFLSLDFKAKAEESMGPYNSLLSNFDNSVDQFLEYYNKLDTLYSSKYFKDGYPLLNKDYINSLIANENPENQIAKTLEIVEELKDIQGKEILYQRRQMLAKNNIDYDMEQLMGLYSQSRAFAYGALTNLRDICGIDFVHLGDYFIERVADIYGNSYMLSNITTVSNELLGHSQSLDDLILIEFDIVKNKSRLLSLSVEEFNVEIANYENSAWNIYKGYVNPNFTETQRKKIIDEYLTIYNLIAKIKYEKIGGSPVLVNDIKLVIKPLPFLPTNWIELSVGNTLQLEATILPENATNKNLRWTSSNPAVVGVIYSETGKEGKLKGISPGFTTVTVSSEDMAKIVEIKVNVISNTNPNPDPYEYFPEETILDRTKIWNIKFTKELNSSLENLSKIYVVDDFDNKITTVHPIAKGNIVQVINTELYKPGKYTIVIENELEALDGKLIKNPVKKIFIVE